MEILPIIYFLYMFVSFYLLVLTLLLYFRNRKVLFEAPKLTKEYSISVLVPAYNEENTIGDTIKHMFEVDYGNIKEVIAINDGSKDGTRDILRRLEKEYKKLKVLNKKNSGKADSLNRALEIARGELIAVVDADSYPDKSSFKKLVGFFDDPEVGAVTAACVPRNRASFLEKLQVIEYKVIAFTRKLLEYIDGIYVTTGTLSIYRRKALKGVGGFDTKNITEDIEATWHVLHDGWKVRMCLDARVTTTTPNKVKPWFRQRRRWAVGGIQCLQKYKSSFLKKGMLGYFIIPFFAVGWVLGLVGIAVFVYVFLRRVISEALITGYSIESGTPILTMNDLFITPSVLNYFGIILFALFFVFTIFVLAVMKDNLLADKKEKQSFFNLLFYMGVYLLVYPIVLIVAINHFIKGKSVWR
jgi:biofilm PGA synthesis N-glycosyltransferase PgaC